MERLHEKKYKTIKIITIISTTLLVVLIILIFPCSGQITHQIGPFYSFTITTLIVSILFVISWFHQVKSNSSKVKDYSLGYSSRKRAKTLTIIGKFLIILGLIVFSSDLYFIFYMT